MSRRVQSLVQGLVQSFGLCLLGIFALIHCGGGGKSGDSGEKRPPVPVIASFTASPASIAAGGSSTLSWSVTGATSLSIDHGAPAISGASGSVSVSPAATTQYTLTATNAGGSATAAATVTVTAAQSVAVSISPATPTVQATKTQQFTATVTGSANTAVTWSVQEASGGAVDASGLYTAPATAGIYHVKATSVADTTKSATATVTVTAATAAPVISAFVASPSTIAPGSSSVLSWTVTGATSLTLSGVGTVTGKLSQTVSPSSTTTYVLTATGAGGVTAASATVTVTGGNPPSQWVMGYYVGYHRGLQTPVQVDYSAMTHIIVGRAVPQADGTWTTTFDIDAVEGPAWAKDVVNRAHAAGIRALLMLGGAGANAGFEPTHDPAIRTKAVANLKTIVDQYGFDGVDFDWEGYNISTFGADVIAYLDAIKAAMPGGILTMPVGWNNSNFNGLKDPHYAEIGKRVDRINMMTYGMFWCGGGWLSWHMAALDGAKGTTPSSLMDSVNVLASGGIPVSKIGIGFGFYGYAYQGGTDTSLPSAPNQNTDQVSVENTIYNNNDNILSYSNLLQSCIKPELSYWDPVPQSAYLSFPQATTLSSIPSSNIRTRYLTYENERSIAAKGNWARAQGLGGVIIWTISEGYLPWRTAGEKDPLMKVVKAALLLPQGAPQILSFTASAPSVSAGQPVTLSWNAPNTTSVAIDQGVAPITGITGSVTVNPAATTSYTLSATNATGAVVTAICTVTVAAAQGVAVSISPASASVPVSGTQQFSATVSGTTDMAVIWSVTDTNGGTVSPSGLYTAPATAGTYQVKATSHADGTKSATAAVTVQAPGAWAALTVNHEVSPDNYNSDVYRWLDSNQKQRTAVLTRNDAIDPGGSHGGMLRQYRYTPAGGAERVITGTGASGLWNGWGYLVNHFGDGSSRWGDDSAEHAGQYRLAFTGRHHALHEFTWTYDMQGAPVKATVHWFMATGQDHPVYAVTYDSSAAGSLGFDTNHLIDSRSPYGDLQFGGDGSNPAVDGVGWGDHYKFFTRDEPFTAQSKWDYSQPNTVPYVLEYIKNPDAEMGSVQTQSWLQHNTGGTWFTDNWGHTSETRVGNTFGAWLMPANWNWPYQLNQYELGDTGSTTSKRLAWGLMYGAVGQLSTGGYGYQSQIVGFPYQSYSVYMVLGRHSDAAVAAQTTQVERKLGATLTASQGTVAAQGPGGVGRTDLVTYDKAGYNPIYGAFELVADATGAFQATLNAAAGDIKNPLFILRGMGALPTQITLGGRALVADQDYFASYEADARRLWLTLNLTWSGSQSLGSNATGAPAPDIQEP